MQVTTEDVFLKDTDKFLLCVQIDKSATKAIEALYALRAYLWAWRDYPNTISKDVFASIIKDMQDAGLEEFTDRQPFEELSHILTGGKE